MEKRDLDIIYSNGINWYMYRDKTVLITGATGRLGHYILESLLDADIKYNLNMRIIGIARNKKKINKLFGEIEDFPNISFLCQDINDNILLDENVDFIFHTAGPAAPVDYFKPVETLWAHVNGTHNILEFAKNHKVKRVFYVSTVETYGEWKSDKMIREEDMGPLRNVNARACYPEAKRLCETMFACYCDEYGIEFCGARLCHTLGPGIVLNDGRAFAEFIGCALNGEDIILHSDGSAMRTYTYTPDVINAIFLIMEKGEYGTFYNVAANENLVSIKDLAYIVADLSPKKTTRVIFTETAAKMSYLPFKLAIMDTTRIRQLGWSPKIDVRTMFKWTMDSFILSNDMGK